MRRPEVLVVAAVAVAWLFTLWWVIAVHPEMQDVFVFLNLYVAGVLYALTLYFDQDRDATLAILLAVFLPPAAWLMFGMHFLVRRFGPRAPD